MYRATRFSGNLPKFLQIECNEPFSQYLCEISRRPMPVGHTILLENDIERVWCLEGAVIFDNVLVL